MKAYKADTISHMINQGVYLFGLNINSIVFPQPEDVERYQKFVMWSLHNILRDCENPIGEFILRHANMMARVMLGQIPEAEDTLCPDLGWDYMRDMEPHRSTPGELSEYYDGEKVEL